MTEEFDFNLSATVIPDTYDELANLDYEVVEDAEETTEEEQVVEEADEVSNEDEILRQRNRRRDFFGI